MVSSKRSTSWWLLTALAVSLSLASACQRNSGPTSLTDREILLAGKPVAGDPTVASTDPTSAPQDTTLDVHVIGSGYDRGSTVELSLDGQTTPKVLTNSTRYLTSRELIANITIAADAVTDLYDVIVTTSQGKRGIGIEMFEVRLGHANPQTGYTKIVLEGLPRSSECQALAINEQREVVGSCWLRIGERHAFFWSAATGMIDLGPGEAQELSDFGGPMVVGWRGTGENPTPVVWELSAGTSPIDLPQACQAEIGINGAGDMIGGTACFTIEGQTLRRPVVWTRAGGGWSVSQQLPLSPGYESGTVFSMSDNGAILGTLFPSAVQGNEWFAWFPPYLEAERIPLTTFTYVLAWDINDNGDVAGTSTQFAGWQSLLWRRSGPTWDAPIEIAKGSAYGINNLATMTGRSVNDAYVWSVATNRIDLGKGHGNDINDQGDVAGFDIPNDRAAIWLAP